MSSYAVSSARRRVADGGCEVNRARGPMLPVVERRLVYGAFCWSWHLTLSCGHTIQRQAFRSNRWVGEPQRRACCRACLLADEDFARCSATGAP